MEIKQILYINKTKFVCDMVSKLCQRAKIECYTLETTEDFTYLIEDLKPEVIVIEEETFGINEDEFWVQVKKSSFKSKTIIMGTLKEGFDASMHLPLDTTTFISDLRLKLDELSKND